MTKEELICFLKENLKISINDESDYDGDMNVKISIKLEDEEITSDSFNIFLPKN